MSAQLHDSGDHVTGLVYRILRSLDTPRSLAVWLLFLNGEHDQLLDLECDPGSYVDGLSFSRDYQATKLLSKAKFLKSNHKPREAAIKKFFQSEEACRATNRRLVLTKGPKPVGFDSVLHRAVQLIASVLGEPDFDDILSSCSWGPGVSSSCKGERTSGYDKFTSVPDVTPDLLPVAHYVVNTWRPWTSAILDVTDPETGLPLPCSVLPSALTAVRGNKVAFVAKNSKTDRAIAVEPTVNSFLQKGIGSVIRRKLRKAGVDLSDQGKNRHLARKGSLNGLLCTIDLESASDTIALELVRMLLPPLWFSLLDRSRSKYGTFDGKTFFYEKFSSMGNGFTFELETLIFYAFTRAIVEEAGSDEPISVYGDDIICDSAVFSRVAEIFSYIGFTVNVKKSFSAGPFRESCGEDFFRGLNVRPYFIKEVPEHPTEWMDIANSLRVHSTRHTEGMYSDSAYRDAWRYCVSRIPKAVRFFGPTTAVGTIWIHSSEKNFRSWNGSCHRVKSLSRVPVRSAGHKAAGHLLAAWLYAKDQAHYGRYTHRGAVRYKERTQYITNWEEIGAWG